VIRAMGYYRAGQTIMVDGEADAIFDAPQVREAQQVLARSHARAQADPAGAFVWTALFQPTKAELRVVREVFDLEWLQVEDAGNSHQRPKWDLEGDRGFLVLKTLTYREESHQVETGQVAVFYGPTYLVTVRHGTTRELRELRDRVARVPLVLDRGPVGLLHAVVDLMVDGYLAVSDRVQEQVERLEVEVFSPSRRDITEAIYLLKRENMEVRRSLSPLVPLATDLAHELRPELPEHMGSAFRDVGEHLLRVVDQTESIDSLLLALVAAANARTQLNQSADQRRMAAWAAIALIPTVVGAIYGMNFRVMPELDWQWGYPVVLGLTGLVMVTVYRRLKSAGWL
jgi:magnesium transporter